MTPLQKFRVRNQIQLKLYKLVDKAHHQGTTEQQAHAEEMWEKFNRTGEIDKVFANSLYKDIKK